MKKKEFISYRDTLPDELQKLNFRYKNTAAIDLALFRNFDSHVRGPFELDTLIEFKCEVLHQLTPKLIRDEKEGYIKKDLERMKYFQSMHDCSIFEILCFVHFPLGINPKFYSLNSHFENNSKKKNHFSITAITEEMKNTYKEFNIIYLSAEECSSKGLYLNTEIELHYWIIS